MKTYKIKDIEISEEQIKDLIKANPELREEKESVPWRAEIGENYSFLSDTFILKGMEEFSPTDNFRYLTGNYFKTKEEVENYKSYQEALGRVTHAILKANDGWVADWKTENKYKFCIFLYNRDMELEFEYWNAHKYTLSLPYIKSQEITEQIIKDYKNDLMVILTYK